MNLKCMSVNTVGIIILSTFVLPAQGAFKCWTNAEGVRECGTSVPPEFSQKGYKVINKMGIQVGEGEHAKTKEEKEEEERLKAEEAEQARLKAEQKERERQEQYRDAVLLSTYTNEQEIITSRDEKINSIEAYIHQTQNHVVKLKKNLKQLRERAAQMERTKKGVTEKQQKAIEDVQGQIAKNNKYISDRRLKQEELNKDYGEQLDRFRKLKKAGLN